MQKRDDMQDSVTNLGQWSTVFFAEQQDAAHALVDKIKKASEENPETFKAAIVKAFNNIPESAKQQLIKLRAQ
ncbi:hypothetical protein PRIPAC_79182 [Pristionchus pacificus]|uniref:Uncharacterized protein n=1 Tax=Pristionchus pacificus TaxID=54126 RepID=A0A2A6CLS0_PRIPA|nr:hypothetical protein PRIPAC_79182 [Pristionchus pacificus]|eukprot:PDM79154.1 hypothetical protein PRIPAC_31733 [Pristionchus pacificus]